MKILVLDQARKGAWSIWDYEKKRLLKYGSFNFPDKKYTYSQAIRLIENLTENLMYENDITAVFIEDINLRRNVLAFKKLAQLQGVLINLFEKSRVLYDTIQPSMWQTYCNARGRTQKEVVQKATSSTNKKASKILSIEFVAKEYHIETDDDNLADAVSIGHYVVNNIKIQNSQIDKE